MLQQIIRLGETKAKSQITLEKFQTLAFSPKALEILSHLPFLVSCSIKFQSLDSGSFLGQVLTKPSQFLLIDVLNLLDLVFIALRLCIASYETTLLQEALGLLELLLKHTASFSEAPELPGLFLTLLHLSLDLDFSLSDDVP